MDGQAWLDWLRSNPEVMLAVGSALVSLVAALFSARETARQRNLQMETLRADVDRASLAWGQEAVEALGRAAALAGDGAAYLVEREFKARRSEIAARLSALADSGRLFFPNVDPGSKGAEKEGAYRGSRPPILDALIYAFYEVEALLHGSDATDARAFILKCRRLLVSELQAHLDPRRRDEVMGRFGHRREAQRQDALVQAGRLALELDARRPGTLTSRKDDGWTGLIGADERREILHAVHERAKP